ncbi:hypothetical protein GR255_25545 [Mycobacterium tuberculosis]|nr:hypothetical protein [Mycobacterium tuberculosis]
MFRYILQRSLTYLVMVFITTTMGKIFVKIVNPPFSPVFRGIFLPSSRFSLAYRLF